MPVPRKEIEHLSLEKLLDRARTQEHRNFFEKMTEKNFVFQSVTVTKRNGFHVTINISLAGNVNPREISQILNDLQPQWRASTQRKRKAEAMREAVLSS
uniref:DRBM domain-containing protein n=1 Tax=Angiostrongylus cantonensis TaxID=6313 RepID=A0A0K0D6Q6_ANGCA